LGKPEGKRPLGRHRHRWEDNITNNLKIIGWEINVAQLTEKWWAVVNMVMKLLVA
jgi:hypothetical protein